MDELNLKRDFLTGSYFEESRKTLDNSFDDYMLLLAPKRLSYRALANAKYNYEKHIKLEFGHRQLASIRSLELQKFLTQKESELANATIIKLYTLLNQIYKMMINWNELSENPLEGVVKPTPNPKEKTTWTKEECQKFLSVAKDYQSYMAFWLALQFGLRLGEVVGLQWKNIDLENNVLYVEEAYHEDQKKLGRLKTRASKRSIPISTQQANFLVHYKKNQSPVSSVVASNSIGGFLMKRNVRRSMELICKRAVVPKITFHELRHTHATLMLEMNEHPKIVQQRKNC